MLFSKNPIQKGSSREKFFFLCAFFCFVLCTALDQLTKHLVVSHIDKFTRIHVIPGFFDLTYITNPGAAFGIFAGKGYMLLAVSVLVFVLLILFFRVITEGWSERILAVSLILSGIVGNSIDRVFRGEVVDFLRVYYKNWEWPSFNVADSCICVGVFIYILSVLVHPEHRKNHETSHESSSSSPSSEESAQ